jgi:D-3-phosphoglycerate dehydrogenase
MPPTVLVWDPLTYLDWEYDIEQRLLAARGVDLVVASTRDEGDAALPWTDVVVVHDGPFRGEEMDRLKADVTGLICYSVGMNQVVLPDAAARGITVRNLPNWASEAVSDHTIAMLLAAHRRIAFYDRGSHATDWSIRRGISHSGIRQFRGQLLGIVGAGRIGRLVAQKARGVGFRTIANDPFIESSGDPLLPLVGLDELLATCDAIALCCSLNDTSERLLREETFARMKPGMTLVNCARGGLIDEAALATALGDGVVAAAALDVREGDEPPDPATDRLAGLPNVILTPHIAFFTEEGFIRYHEECAEVALELLESRGRLAPALEGAAR